MGGRRQARAVRADGTAHRRRWQPAQGSALARGMPSFRCCGLRDSACARGCGRSLESGRAHGLLNSGYCATTLDARGWWPFTCGIPCSRQRGGRARQVRSSACRVSAQRASRDVLFVAQLYRGRDPAAPLSVARLCAISFIRLYSGLYYTVVECFQSKDKSIDTSRFTAPCCTTTLCVW